jgi:ATP-binding cassette, subfamily D (ALD), member 3
MDHTNMVLNKRLFMGTFDSMLVKYGAVLVGYAILGQPVFGSGSQEYLKKVGQDASAITRDYIRNSSLLINLAKAIGRIVVSYKDVQYLAGYTTLVYEMDEVLTDLKRGQYKRPQVNANKFDKIDKVETFSNQSRGVIKESESIKFDDVPIVSPNGDVLIKTITFEISPSMNCIISGPNGCGKSSLFRILGRLWPLFSGTLHCPKLEKIFYIPQVTPISLLISSKL